MSKSNIIKLLKHRFSQCITLLTILGCSFGASAQLISSDAGVNESAERFIHVYMDHLYDPDSVQTRSNLALLVERVKGSGISAIYLQASHDSDGDGSADELYFANRHLPIKADIFKQVASALQQQAGVKVYAWLPVMAYDLGGKFAYVNDRKLGRPSPDRPLRLSPWNQTSRRVLQEIYEDLGKQSCFDGLLFHHDGFLNDYEGQGSQPTRQSALVAEGLKKTQQLVDLTLALRNAAGRYRQGGVAGLKTARHIYSSLVTEPSSQQWFAQSMEAFAKVYDYTLVLAMPYMEEVDDPQAWLATLAQKALTKVPASSLAFDLQSRNWNTDEPVDDEELAQWMATINQQGVIHYGYDYDDFYNNQPNLVELERVFVTPLPSEGMVTEGTLLLGGHLGHLAPTGPAQRLVHVDLDYLYDASPKQMEHNVSLLLQRLQGYGITTVYLQAYADANGDGVAEGLYFPNRHMPMRANMFKTVAKALRAQGLKVFAWMPVMAYDMGPDYQYVTDHRTGIMTPDLYIRLAPWDPAARQVLVDIYEDLGRNAEFDGVLFHDDGFFTETEGPVDVNAPWVNGMSPERQKTQYLVDLTIELRDAAARYREGGLAGLQTSRNVYASIVLNPISERWFAQNMQLFANSYDYTAVMAMPYMEKAQNPAQWMADIAEKALAMIPADRLLFELQSRNWRTHRSIPDEELADWMRIIQQKGVRHFGYYPDDFYNNQPNLSILRPVFVEERATN